MPKLTTTRLVLATMTVSAVALGAAGSVEAHSNEIDATCDHVDVALFDYSTTAGPNTVEIRTDGATRVSTTFQTSYDTRVTFDDPTVDHTYRVIVDSPSFPSASFDTGDRTISCEPTTTSSAPTTTTTTTTVGGGAGTTTTTAVGSGAGTTTTTTTTATTATTAVGSGPGSTTTTTAVAAQPPSQQATTTTVVGGAGGGGGGGGLAPAGTLPATGGDADRFGPLAGAALLLVLAGGTLVAAVSRRAS
jgi:LPXTG-motif cell wall-anchored protein